MKYYAIEMTGSDKVARIQYASDPLAALRSIMTLSQNPNITLGIMCEFDVPVPATETDSHIKRSYIMQFAKEAVARWKPNEPAPAPDNAKVCIQFVDQSLRDKLIPTTKKMSNMMRRPQVEVTADSIERAMETILNAVTTTLPRADMITVETVAQTLAYEAGYRLNDHGRWDCGQSPTRYCEEGDERALEAGFRVGDPINNNPRCDACCLCNALVPRDGTNAVLTCRSCHAKILMSTTLHSLVSNQGTAITPTTLCNACMTLRNIEIVQTNARTINEQHTIGTDDYIDPTGPFVDSSENTEISCTICGARRVGE